MSGRGLALVLVVGVTADHPQVGGQGLLATRLVLLGVEGSLVRGDLAHVLFAGSHCAGHSRELRAHLDLGRLDRRGALVGVSRLHIHALAVRVGGRCLAVSQDLVRAVAVTIHFLGLAGGTLYKFIHRIQLCVCHSNSALFSSSCRARGLRLG